MSSTGTVPCLPRLALLPALFCLGGCSVLGIRTTEEPAYDVILQEGDFELRDYPELVVAETIVSGDLLSSEGDAFRRLFRYISGANTAERGIAMTAPVIQEETSQEIAMTAPVLQEDTGQGWRMAFVLPAEIGPAEAPRPTDPAVELRTVAPRRVAVVRFNGSRSERRIDEQEARLREWLEANGWNARSVARSAGYDPPFTLPVFRRNEVWIEVGAGAGSRPGS